MIHHLKIYPEHFSAVCTGIKRAELRKNDRDFKVGDTLHLMETPKDSCNPTGEFINAVVTHIADVGEWLPGYVMLSIEREHGYAAPQLPQPVAAVIPDEMAITAEMNLFQKSFAQGYNTFRADMLQGDAVRQPKLADGWVAVPVEPTADMIAAAMNSDDVSFDKKDDTMFRVHHGVIWRAMLAAVPQQGVK